MEDNTNVNAAILERLEKVVESLQDNSVKMGQLLAVHNEKLDKQDRIDAVLGKVDRRNKKQKNYPKEYVQMFRDATKGNRLKSVLK